MTDRAATGSTTALLVIDVQCAMFDPPPAPYRGEELLAIIRGLIDRARAAGAAVMYVRHIDENYEPMNLGAPGWQVHSAVAPEPGDVVVDKYGCDSFYGTPLQAELAAQGIERLVIAGLQTEMCVDTACRSALFRDYDVVLASDAHSTWDNKNLTAEQVIAHHNATLAGVPHPTKGIVVTPSCEILFADAPAAIA